MGDNLAAIREKAQAHQEESKAKRFRDRGGLWQPLSPSKNTLLGILNSAEFLNIAEADPVMAQKEEEVKQSEAAHKQAVQTSGKVRSTTKGQALKLGHEGKHQTELVKLKVTRKAGSKSKHKGKMVSDADVDPTTLDIEISKRTVEATARETTLAIVNDDVDRQPSTRGLPPRPKRVNKKRNLREDSDQEDEEDDYRPSPAKKPRTRGPAVVKPRTKRQTTVLKQSNRQSKPKATVVELEDKVLVKNGEGGSKSTRATAHPNSEDASVSKSSTKHGRKRALATELSSADEEQPSPPKRRRTKATITVESTPKKSKAKLMTSSIKPDESVDDLDTSKACVREVSKSRSSTKSKIRATGGKSRQLPSDEGSDSKTNAEPMEHGSGEKTNFRDGGLSTIMEAEEDLGEDTVRADVMQVEEVPKKQRPSSDGIGSTTTKQKPPPEKRRRTATMDNAGGHQAILERSKDVVLAKTLKTRSNVVTRAHTDDAESSGKPAQADAQKMNAATGMTKRRRKKVGAADVKDTCRTMDKATTVPEHSDSYEEPAETSNPKRTRANRKRKQPVDVLPPLSRRSSPFDDLQDPALSAEESTAKALSKKTIDKRARLKAKVDSKTRTVEEDECEPVPGTSPKRSQEASQEKELRKKPVRRGKPPPLRDVHFEAVVDSEADELDFLS